MTRELRIKIEDFTKLLIKSENLKHNFDINELAKKLDIEIIKVPADSLSETEIRDHGFVICDNKYKLYCLDWTQDLEKIPRYNKEQQQKYEEKKEYCERMQRWVIAEALGDLLYFMMEFDQDKIQLGHTRKFLYDNQELHYGNFNYKPQYIQMVNQQFAASLLMPEIDYESFLNLQFEIAEEFGWDVNVIQEICNEFGVTSMQAVRRGHGLGLITNKCVPEVSYTKIKRK